MHFELTVALKYLIPKWRQLSVSIISLISVLVISLVVWLIVLFLSVTDGIEKKWIDELVALNAHVKMSPTDEYYRSYYYQIDSVSLNSNFTSKTIGEKLSSAESDPYDPLLDRELSFDFPSPDRYDDGRLKDIVKEGYEAINSLPYAGVRPQEYEVSFGNLRLQLLREGPDPGETQQSFLTQVSYVASYDGENGRMSKMILPPSSDDFNNLLKAIVQKSPSPFSDNVEEASEVVTPAFKESLAGFFKNLEIKELKTANGFVLNPSFYPKSGTVKGIGIIRYGQVVRAFLPKTLQQLPALEEKLKAFGYQTQPLLLVFNENHPFFSFEENLVPAGGRAILLDEEIPFEARLIESSLEKATTLADLQFEMQGSIQQLLLSGHTHFKHLSIGSAQALGEAQSESPFWISPSGKNKIAQIPKAGPHNPLGEGLLISKYFQNNGVKLGDQGYIAYYAQTGSSMQEQRIPVYVAGFYDPGMIPVGNKLIYVNPHVTAILRGNTVVADPLLGNGLNIWLRNIDEASKFKNSLIQGLESRGIAKYWNVQSFHDYEFTRPILEQLRSDKNLFALIAVIILIVACSNIISMLILLVNDKKREIGILQSMGASPQRIAFIFGFCGFVTGLISCIIGVAAAILTLKNLQSLVDLLSFLQGREAFQTAFYGSTLPNTLSYSALVLVLIATLLISLLAGIVPAFKASRIRPTEILRSQ